MNPSDERLREMMDHIEEVKGRDGEPAARRRWLSGRRGAAVIVALVATLALGWGLTQRNESQPTSPDQVPLIEADDQPAKHRPEDPGGMVFPDQDKRVYGVFDSSSQEAEGAERLLPPPEEPVTVEPLPAEAEPVAPEPGTVGANGESAGPAAEAEPATIGSLLEDSAVGAENAGADEGTEAAVEPAPEPSSEASPAWRVQVGAVKDSAKIEPEWARLKAKLGPLIEGLPTTVETADLGTDQGLYHRLQIGAFADREGADSLCAAIKKLMVDCLVVHR